MKSLLTWILMIGLVLGLAQCGETTGDDPTPDPNTPKIQLLAGTSSKAWVMTSSKIDGEEVIDQELACSRDDNMVYRVAKTYEWNEGGSKCNAKDPQVYETGTWEFGSGETEIVLNNELKYKIIKLTANTLQISAKNVFGETEELTFKAN
ncbi:MAG: lipocalin family protein [Spirosomataceae bacterium]